MHCGSCGAEIEYEQAFCAGCGQPTAAAASVGAPNSNTVSFEFTASALPLFGWMLLVGLSFVLIVPAPFAMVSWWRWFYSHIKPSDGRAFEFKAEPGDLWIFTTVYAVVSWSGAFTGWTGEEDNDALVGLVSFVQMLGSIAMMWWGMRLVASWTDRDNQRLSFSGSLLGVLGWTLAAYVGFLTIIGWAWVYEHYSRWLAGRVEGLKGRVEFVGQGHQILWRGFVMFLFCLPIVTIPWATRWLYAWYIEQFRLDVRPG